MHSFKKSTNAFFSNISFGINLKYDEKSCIAPWKPPLFDGTSFVLYKYSKYRVSAPFGAPIR